jgi:3',5'-cyclic AMP phosphodiesterase CpdA
VLIHHPPLPGMTSWRKAVADAGALARVLDRGGAELVLHGHLHRNSMVAGPGHLRVYGTASASATDHGIGRGAAFRCFDVVRHAGGFRIDMRLTAVDHHGAQRELERDVWEVGAATPRPSAASAAR